MPIVDSIDKKVKEELMEVGVPSLTFDNWTSINNVNYIAICAHYINAQMVMCDRCIVLEPYDVTHSAADMKQELVRLLDKYGLKAVSGTVVGDVEGDVEAFEGMLLDDDPPGKQLHDVTLKSTKFTKLVQCTLSIKQFKLLSINN